MKVVKKYFNNKVILFKYDSYFDNRGSFSETYNKKNLNIYGINDNFVQDNQSISKKKHELLKTADNLHAALDSLLVNIKNDSNEFETFC